MAAAAPHLAARSGLGNRGDRGQSDRNVALLSFQGLQCLQASHGEGQLEIILSE